MYVCRLIQIPRLYDVYKRGGEIESFGQMLNNIFAPLFVVSLNPGTHLLPPLPYPLLLAQPCHVCLSVCVCCVFQRAILRCITSCRRWWASM